MTALQEVLERLIESGLTGDEASELLKELITELVMDLD